jgi:hypothetical protein
MVLKIALKVLMMATIKEPKQIDPKEVVIARLNALRG